MFIRAPSARALAAVLQPVNHKRQKAPVMFYRIAWPPEHCGTWNGSLIMRQPVKNLFRGAGLPRGRTQAVAQEFDTADVFAQNHRARRFQGVFHASGLNQRISIAIAADPGPET